MDTKYVIHDYFAGQENVSCVYLFGSVAAGKQNKFSDVDIAVLFDPDVSRRLFSQKRLSFMDDLSRLLDRDVDVVVLNIVSCFLKFQVIKNGLRIYECPDRVERAFEARTIMEYFDFFPIRKRMETALINNIKGHKDG